MKPATRKKRPEKKSETIEVRVSYTEKLAFMEACRQAGTTASHAIRDYIGDFQTPGGGKKNATKIAASLIFAALLLLAVGSLYLSQRALDPATTGERVVRYFDQDGDGILTTADAENSEGAETIQWLLTTADQNADGRIDSEEINALADVLIELRGTHPDGMPAGASEQIIIIPPGLTPLEQQAFLEKAGFTKAVSLENQARLQRLIDALAVPDDND